MNELGSFEAFRSQPSPETLLALLTAHQDAIYTVCLQVLCHREDAEDATQAVLIKLASGAGNVREPRAFKSWLYRIAFNTAVDYRRRRESRLRVQEGSGSMTDKAMPPAALDGLHDALADLPDSDRLLLAEYYFEKATLEDLGKREGITGVALWKRLEMAREKLRRGLAGAGFLLGTNQITQALESVTRASAPYGIVASTIASKAALAAGGAAVGSSKGIGIALTLVLLLVLGGGLYVFLPREATQPPDSAKKPDAIIPAPTSTRPDETQGKANEKPTRGDLSACRRLLAHSLVNFRRTDVLRWAHAAELLHAGGHPWFESLAKEFAATSGPDFFPIVKSLLADTESDAAKFVLAALLGRSRLPEAVGILAALTGEATDVWVTQSALYSIGLIRSPEGFSFLRSYWDQAKAKGEPLAPATLKALGLFGPEAIPLLAAEAQAEKSLFKDRAEYLGLLRGDDCTDALLALLETEENGAVREGAARALTYNLTPKTLPAILALYERTQDPKLKAAMLYGLGVVQRVPPLWESSVEVRKEFALRVVQTSVFPSGTLMLDRALIHFSALTSSETFLAKFEGLNRESAGKDYDVLLREVLAAYSRMPGHETRLANLMTRSGISQEQQERMRAGGLMKTEVELTPEITKALLDSIRTAKPYQPKYEIALESLSRPGPHESAWSSAMLDAYESCATEKDRLSLLDNLVTVLYGKRDRAVGLPAGFLAAVLTGSYSVDAKVYAAYACFSSSDLDLDPQVLKQVAGLFGPSMKWATESSLATGDFKMVQLAPSVLGDFYSRYGSTKDVVWLRKLPDDFPYPAALKGAEKVLRDQLSHESRRAIDAIRLRN
jgi:RNA polymerase sigma factor (sigma-70 family)